MLEGLGLGGLAWLGLAALGLGLGLEGLAGLGLVLAG